MLLFNRQTQGEYTWTQNEKVVAKESKAILMREADVLYGQSIKCKVSNRVSSSSSEPRVEECSRKSEYIRYTHVFVPRNMNTFLMVIETIPKTPNRLRVALSLFKSA